MDSVENNKKRTYIHKKLKYKLNIYDNDIDKKVLHHQSIYKIDHNKLYEYLKNLGKI